MKHNLSLSHYKLLQDCVEAGAPAVVTSAAARRRHHHIKAFLIEIIVKLEAKKLQERQPK